MFKNESLFHQKSSQNVGDCAYTTLAHYIEIGKVPAPESVIPGIRPTHVWTEEEIESLRELLPKIANGRKTRYKKQSTISTQQSAKTKKKAQARVPVPHKKEVKTRNLNGRRPVLSAPNAP